jgi:hypothetical protein
VELTKQTKKYCFDHKEDKMNRLFGKGKEKQPPPNLTDGGKTLTTIRTNNAWGGSGTFSTESINGDGYVSFKRVLTNKRLFPILCTL